MAVDLEARLFSIQELKKGLYIGTGEAWNYLQRLEEIDAAPKLHAQKINETAGLSDGDYLATPERITGIASVLMYSARENDNLLGEVFGVGEDQDKPFEELEDQKDLDLLFDLLESGKKEALTPQEEAVVREYDTFFYERPDLITFLYDASHALPEIIFEPDSGYDNLKFFCTQDVLPTNRDLLSGLFLYEEGSKTSIPIPETTAYALGALTNLFSKAKDAQVRTDVGMQQFLQAYLLDKINQRSSLEGVRPETVENITVRVGDSLQDQSLERACSRKTFSRAQTEQREGAFARQLPIAQMVERVKRDRVHGIFEYQRQIINHFLATNNVGSYQELVENRDERLGDARRRMKGYKKLDVSEFIIRNAQQVLDFNEFMRDLVGREKNYVKRMLGESWKDN